MDHPVLWQKYVRPPPLSERRQIEDNIYISQTIRPRTRKKPFFVFIRAAKCLKDAQSLLSRYFFSKCTFPEVSHLIPISKDPFLIEFVAKTAHFGSVRGKGKEGILVAYSLRHSGKGKVLKSNKIVFPQSLFTKSISDFLSFFFLLLFGKKVFFFVGEFLPHRVSRSL